MTMAITRGGKGTVWPSGYGNLYMVDMPAFESLPEMPET